MLSVYAQYIFYSFSAGTVFTRQILTSKDGPRAEWCKALKYLYLNQETEVFSI